MEQYRVTKYNPLFRDKNGNYKSDDWTSINDIGAEFSGKVLSKDNYLHVENAYINTISYLLELTTKEPVKVSSLEWKRKSKNKYDVSKLLDPEEILDIELYNGLNLTREQVAIVSRLNLRGVLWCKLEVKNSFFVHFGYDYYMYIGCKKIDEKDISFINSGGLFVEPFNSPYL